MNKDQINLKDTNITNKIFYLDFIRVIAIFMVILYHFNGELISKNSNNIILGQTVFRQAIGDLGVTLFIILSGASLMQSSLKNFALLNFIKRRVLGILPAYWLCYFIVFTLLFIKNGSIVNYYPKWTVLLTVFGLDGFLLYKIPSYYLIGEWFIGFILILYLIFPFLRYLILKNPFLAIISVISFSYFSHTYYDDIFIVNEARNPIIRLPEFLFGMIYIFKIKKCELNFLFLITMLLTYFAIYEPNIQIQYYGLILGISIFLILTKVSAIFERSNSLRNLIIKGSEYSFVAFLVHHQLIYNLLPYFDVAKFGMAENYYLFFLILFLSFMTGKYFNQSIFKIREFVTSILNINYLNILRKKNFIFATRYLTLLVGLIILISSLFGGILNYSPIPIKDEWIEIVGLQKDILTHFYQSNTSAKIPQFHELTRSILIWLDLILFNGNRLFLFCTILLSQFLIAITLFLKYCKNANSNQNTLQVLGIIIGFLFSWLQYEIFTSTLGNSFNLVYLLSILSIAVLTSNIKNSYIKVIVSIFFGLLASSSAKFGFLIFPILFLISLINKNNILHSLFILLTWIIIWAISLFNFELLLYSFDFYAENFFDFLKLFITVLGAPFGSIFSIQFVSLIFGFFNITSFVILLYISVKKNELSQYKIFLFGTYSIILILSVTNINWIELLADQMVFPSRYFIGPLLSFVVISLLVIDSIKSPFKVINYLFFTFIVLFIISFSQFKILPNYSSLYNYKLAVLTHKISFFIPSLYRITFPEDNVNFPSIIKYAEDNNLGIYKIDWLNQVGHVSFSSDLRDDSLCTGVVDSEVNDGNWQILNGWVISNLDNNNANILIVIVNANANVVGYGLTGSSRVDVFNAIKGAPLNSGWNAFASNDSNLDAYAFISNKFCHLRK
jgi:peptidoglycan/LPS O-acetylase OafA/YrhL